MSQGDNEDRDSADDDARWFLYARMGSWLFPGLGHLMLDDRRGYLWLVVWGTAAVLTWTSVLSTLVGVLVALLPWVGAQISVHRRVELLTRDPWAP